MPKTKLGIWSVRFIFISLIFFVLIRLTVLIDYMTRETATLMPVVGSDPTSDEWFLLAMAMLVTFFGALSFITSLISIVKFKDQSLGVFLSLGFGVFIIIKELQILFS